MASFIFLQILQCPRNGRIILKAACTSHPLVWRQPQTSLGSFDLLGAPEQAAHV